QQTVVTNSWLSRCYRTRQLSGPCSYGQISLRFRLMAEPGWICPYSTFKVSTIDEGAGMIWVKGWKQRVACHPHDGHAARPQPSVVECATGFRHVATPDDMIDMP